MNSKVFTAGDDGCYAAHVIDECCSRGVADFRDEAMTIVPENSFVIRKIHTLIQQRRSRNRTYECSASTFPVI